MSYRWSCLILLAKLHESAMQANQAGLAVNGQDAIVLLRTAYGGILLMTAGQTYQLFLCFQILRKARRGWQTSRRPYMLASLVIVLSSMLVLLVDILDKGAMLTRATAVEPGTLYPPDPFWWHIVSPAAIGCIHLVGDGLLAWRTYILWDGHGFVRLLPLFPFIASLGTLIAYIIISLKWALHPTQSGVSQVIKLQSAYFITSISVNLVATALICFRLLSLKRRVDKAFGGRRLQSDVPYMRISTILVESALPFTVLGLACAVLTALMEIPEICVAIHAAYQVLWPLWVVSCALAPQLIIARVISGHSWTNDPTRHIEEMTFSLQFAVRSKTYRRDSETFSHAISTPDLSHTPSLDPSKLEDT